MSRSHGWVWPALLALIAPQPTVIVSFSPAADDQNDWTSLAWPAMICSEPSGETIQTRV